MKKNGTVNGDRMVVDTNGFIVAVVVAVIATIMMTVLSSSLHYFIK